MSNLLTEKGYCGGEQFWNESLVLDNWYPEFTECFQHTVLTFVPCGFLWISSIILLLYLKNAHQYIILGTTWLLVTRLILAMAMSLLSAIHLFVPLDDKSDEHGSYPPSFYVSKSVWAMTFLYAAVLTNISHKHGLPTPCILFIFWFMSMTAHVVPVYTLAVQQDYNTRMMLFVIACFVLATLLIYLILQGIGEKEFDLVHPSPTGKPSPQVNSSYISRLVFSWCFPYVYKGFKTIIVASDLIDLPPAMQCSSIVPSFLFEWAKEMANTGWDRGSIAMPYGSSCSNFSFFNSINKGSSKGEPSETTRLLPERAEKEKEVTRKKHIPSLYKVLAKLFYLHLFKCQLVGLMADMLLYVNPILLNLLISYVDDKDSYPQWHGFFLAGSFFVVVFGNSVMTNFRFYNAWNIGVKVKTVLAAAVYKKSLTMNADSRRKFTVGTTVNLMAVDCTRFQDLTTNLYVIVSWPFQMSIALYMLYNTLGIAFVAPIVVLIILLPITIKTSTLARKYQAIQIGIKDQRIKLMNEILSGIKVLKLYAWEPSFEAKIAEIRKREVSTMKTAVKYQSVNTIVMLTTPVALVVTTFVAYVLITGDTLTPDKAFVAMSILNNIKTPMTTLPMFMSSAIQCHVSMKRLRDYLSGVDLEPRDTTSATDEHPIMMENGTYLWDRERPPVLKNVSLKVPQGSLVAVVGQVGAGKSSLISALLGELERINGFGSIKGSIGYVPQQAWVQNMSLRANILFHKPMDEKWYRKTIAGCALESDICLLPGGEMTEIGEKGINLSGGQKQRISLARAVYQQADVYLLDDPLSAVDAHVGKHIFENIIGPKGMISNKTRLLVTHGIHWLPFVDSIIVMDRGRVTEAGTYKELMSHNGPFAEFLRTYLLEHEDEDLDDPEIQEWKDKMIEQVESLSDDEFTRSQLKKSLSLPSGNFKERSLKHQIPAKTSESAPEVMTKQQNDRLIEDEKTEKGRVKGAVFMSFLQAFGASPALVVMLSLIIYNSCFVAQGIWLSEWTSDPFLSNASNAVIDPDTYDRKTSTYLGVYAVIGICQIIGNGVFVMLLLVQFVNASWHLHNSMLSNILHQPMAFFDTTPLGRVLNRFSKEVDVVDSSLARQARIVLQALFTLLSTVITITYASPFFLAVIVPVAIIYYLMQKFYIPSSRQFRRIESITRSPLFSNFAETISGAMSIRAYSVMDKFFYNCQDKIDINNFWFVCSACSARWLRIRLEALGNLIVLFAGLFAVLSDISGSLVGLAITYALQLTGNLNMMVQNATQMETNFISLERIVEYISLPPEPDWIVVTKRPEPKWPQEGQVVFGQYSTRYRQGLDLVLRKISIQIQPGEKVGVVGRTGAGKSSLSLALFRVLEAAEGSVIIDGLDISTIGLHDLRSRLTILPQDPVLFTGTVRFNLDPFDVHSDDALWEALESAHLSTFVREMPGGLAYMCEEGGQNLSVGQRQLMCLARSLLRKTKILVLDEATAAVDIETDTWLQETIRKAFKECTVLTVAHRLNTIIDYDRILVLSAGRIAEFDTPQNLLANKNTIFYSMAKESNLV